MRRRRQKPCTASWRFWADAKGKGGRLGVAATERTLTLMSRVPEPIRDMLMRRLRELTGLGLIGLAGIAAVALATWSVQDPSLSHATSKPVRNLLG
jgi:DNA segregation ATPase FtsK/SpoIIIE, S-DNA-T family